MRLAKIATKRNKTKTSSLHSTPQEHSPITQHFDSPRSHNAPSDSQAASRGAISGATTELSSGPLAGWPHHTAVRGRRISVASSRGPSHERLTLHPAHIGRPDAALHLQVTVEDEDLFGADPAAAGHGASDRLPPVVNVHQLVTGRPAADRQKVIPSLTKHKSQTSFQSRHTKAGDSEVSEAWLGRKVTS